MLEIDIKGSEMIKELGINSKSVKNSSSTRVKERRSNSNNRNGAI
jgi:hypothetical protein